MTNKEAIDKIRWTPLMRMPNEHGELKEALSMAIEALKKQTPKKVVWVKSHTWGIVKDQPVCPVCDGDLIRTEFFCEGSKVSYCDTCGQAIDWSEK